MCTISIHALREEGDIPVIKQYFGANAFLSTPSARRATRFCWRPGGGPWHFYPRPPRGGRLEIARTPKNSIKFLSTPSARRATGDREDPEKLHQISIHALREEGDLPLPLLLLPNWLFLSTPSARRATRYAARIAGSAKFLSTPSARRATEDVQHLNLHTFNFYPRPPRGGRRAKHKRTVLDISHFYPRPPRGGRRANAIDKTTNTNISIHALREEGDHLPSFCANSLILFLSTPSARRATYSKAFSRQKYEISIHALREEGDRPYPR